MRKPTFSVYLPAQGPGVCCTGHVLEAWNLESKSAREDRCLSKEWGVPWVVLALKHPLAAGTFRQTSSVAEAGHTEQKHQGLLSVGGLEASQHHCRGRKVPTGVVLGTVCTATHTGLAPTACHCTVPRSLPGHALNIPFPDETDRGSPTWPRAL